MLRGGWTHAVPGDMETLIASNLLAENQNEHDTDLQHTWVNDHEGCVILSWRSGDWLPRLLKAQFGLLGNWMTAWTVQCIVQSGYWLLGLCNAQFQLGRTDGLGTNMWNFLGEVATILQNAQNSPRGQFQVGMQKYREEGEPTFPKLRNVALLKAKHGPRLARLAEGQLKAGNLVNAWWHYVIAEVIDSAWKTWMKYSANKSTCMWVRQFDSWANVCEK